MDNGVDKAESLIKPTYPVMKFHCRKLGDLTDPPVRASY